MNKRVRNLKKGIKIHEKYNTGKYILYDKANGALYAEQIDWNHVEQSPDSYFLKKKDGNDDLLFNWFFWVICFLYITWCVHLSFKLSFECLFDSDTKHYWLASIMMTVGLLGVEGIKHMLKNIPKNKERKI